MINKRLYNRLYKIVLEYNAFHNSEVSILYRMIEKNIDIEVKKDYFPGTLIKRLYEEIKDYAFVIRQVEKGYILRVIA